ncbi:hypothetical protein [Microbacterium sp. No. 7]|uniref:hypothetical protein n=1 Tax=Microbacterium sp. No. 7 TaxID=1714373 RepID=UPI0006D0F6BF|nr:hypothetical protein [Microbacterium sp. No. 7]ALJ21383.1 hypothetical protein AOA12_16350 [Microbacterium sp. No. 7]
MATKKRATGWARTGAALIAAGVLALAGCSAPATGGGGGSTGDAAADECGTIPDLGATDPGNLLADFSEDAQAAFNAYPLAVEESAWIDYKA